jgi:opacity protein-like surface antigen
VSCTRGRTWATALAGLLVVAGPLAGQSLADYDYQNLSFQGIGVDWGYLFPSRVDRTQSIGIRMDLGYLGPGLRILPGITYWSSDFKHSEVADLENRVASLVQNQTGGPPPTVDLGNIRWTDVALSLDAQVVWRVPYNILTFAGVGASAHILNGSGEAINGTFVEDLLDSVAAGFDLSAGLEYPLNDRLHVYGSSRYEIMGDLQYFQIRLGTQVMVGSGGASGGAGSR